MLFIIIKTIKLAKSEYGHTYCIGNESPFEYPLGVGADLRQQHQHKEAHKFPEDLTRFLNSVCSVTA